MKLYHVPDVGYFQHHSLGGEPIAKEIEELEVRCRLDMDPATAVGLLNAGATNWFEIEIIGHIQFEKANYGDYCYIVSREGIRNGKKARFTL